LLTGPGGEGSRLLTVRDGHGSSTPVADDA